MLKHLKKGVCLKPIFLSSIVASTLLLSGCGGGSSSSTEATTEASTDTSTEATTSSLTGTLIDDTVSGVSYVNGAVTGYTDENGQFPYTSGTVEFYVGKIKIGGVSSLPEDKQVFIQDIVGVERTNVENEKVLKIARFLQSLDSDEETEKIEITKTDFEKFNTDENTTIDNITVDSVLTKAGFSADKIKSNDDVKKHMEGVLKKHKIVDDNKAPTITSSSPSNDATTIALDSKIEIKFSEYMPREQMTSENIELKNDDTVIATTLSFKGDTLRVTPKSPLESGKVYKLTLKKALKDFAGNSLEEDNVISFSTVESDTISPKISSSTPANNDVKIGVSQNLTITFNESLDNSSAINTNNISLVKRSDNSTVEVTLKYDDSTKMITVDPSVELTDNSFYTLTVKTGIKDKNLNALASNQEIDFMVGDEISFNKGEFKVIKSPITGKAWLDRNLGAFGVCTKSRLDSSYTSDKIYASDQLPCIGNYYQWGRLADGHEVIDSDTTTTQLTSYNDDEASENFVSESSDWLKSGVDNDGKQRVAQWAKTDGTSICPQGFRVPTITELKNETISYNKKNDEKIGAVKVIDRDTAFKNFLKLPISGYREAEKGEYPTLGNSVSFWTNSIDGTKVKAIFIGKDDSKEIGKEVSLDRATGAHVRCIKDLKNSVKQKKMIPVEEPNPT